ncbi:hypothetical protein Tco_1427329 [Tanacetum coccineum]
MDLRVIAEIPGLPILPLYGDGAQSLEAMFRMRKSARCSSINVHSVDSLTRCIYLNGLFASFLPAAMTAHDRLVSSIVSSQLAAQLEHIHLVVWALSAYNTRVSIPHSACLSGLRIGGWFGRCLNPSMLLSPLVIVMCCTCRSPPPAAFPQTRVAFSAVLRGSAAPPLMKDLVNFQNTIHQSLGNPIHQPFDKVRVFYSSYTLILRISGQTLDVMHSSYSALRRNACGLPLALFYTLARRRQGSWHTSSIE